jgi:DNA-binding PadR family transcriptional regulator
MSATRLLVLGMVRAQGRTHGYRVGNVLHEIGAHEWANVKWGSVYHALKQLTRQDLLRAYEEEPGDNGQPRTEYEITPEGEAEFLRLLRETVQSPDPHNDLRAAGLAFLPALSRSEAIGLLERRLLALESDYAELKPHHFVDGEHAEVLGELKEAGVPSVVGEMLGMWAHLIDAEISWTRGLLRRLRAGVHTMAGEDPYPWGMPGGTQSPAP